MKKPFFIIVFFVLSIQFNHSLAQIGGTSTFNFLTLPLSARTSSLGGNSIAVKDADINLVLDNPSLLDSSMNKNFALNYVNYFTDVNYANALYGFHIKNVGTFSAGLNYFNYGKFIEADENGTITGEFKAGDYLLNLGYGKSIDSSFSIGTNFKTIYSSYSVYSSAATAFDLAATYYKNKKKITLAAVIKNIGWQWKPYTPKNHEPLPFEIQLGVSKKLKHAPFRFSIIAQHLEKWDLTYNDPLSLANNSQPLSKEVTEKSKVEKFGDKVMRHLIFGTELSITKNFNIRAGYNYKRRKELKIESTPGAPGFSFGFGIKISKFQLSYGRAIYHLAGSSNTLSIGTNLSDFRSKN